MLRDVGMVVSKPLRLSVGTTAGKQDRTCVYIHVYMHTNIYTQVTASLLLCYTRHPSAGYALVRLVRN